MHTQTLLAMPVGEANKSVPIPHRPVRVFLLSDCRLLREAFARVLKDYAGISLVGAQEFSAVTAAEIIAAGCNMLLIDPVNVSKFDSQILDDLQGRIFDFQILFIQLEARISEILSSILKLARSKGGFVREGNRTGP